MRYLTFHGLRPKIAEHKLDKGYASVAVNLDLYSGELRPLRAPLISAPMFRADGSLFGLSDKVGALYRAGQTWVAWPTHTWVVPDVTAEPTYEAFLYVEDGALYWQTEQRLLQGCAPVKVGTPAPCVCPDLLVVTCPSACDSTKQLASCGPNEFANVDMTPPLACVTDAGTGENCLPGTPELRGYRHTWLREYPCCTGKWEESAPSPIQYVEVRPGETVILTPKDAPPAGVTGARWYRSAVSTEGVLVWLAVGEAILPGRVFDDVDAMGLGDVLTTEHEYPPPACLEGIARVGRAQLLGWSGKTLWTSSPHLPHAWHSDEDVVQIQYPVVGALGLTPMLEGAESTFEAHVVTQGKPYRVVTSTDNTALHVMEVQVHEPCINPRSLIDMQGGRSGYASPRGFIRFSGEGIENITDGWMTEHEWMHRDPASAVFGFWHERLFMAAPDRDGFLITLAPDDGARPREFVNHTVRAAAMYSRADTNLTLAYDNNGHVYAWGAGALLTWVWEAAAHVLGGLWHPTALKVVHEQTWRWHDIEEAQAQWVASGLSLEAFMEDNPRWRHLYSQLQRKGGVAFAVLRHGRTVDHGVIRDVMPRRLRRVSRGLEWSIRLQGTAHVREVHLATSVKDMAYNGAEGD